jgi:ketosteroid isomerase-like protein
MSEMLRVLDRGLSLLWREDRPEEAVRALGPDFEWAVPNHPDGEVRRGPDSVVEFFQDWRRQFSELELDWELADAGAGRALAVFSMTGRGSVSGAPVEMHFVQLWRFRDGLFVRMVMAGSPQLAIARDGLETYQRDGSDAVVGVFTEDVVWEEDPEWPDGQVWHGREGVRAAFRERLESTSIAVELDQASERDNRVLLLMRWAAEGLGSGAQAVLRPAMILEFEGRLISHARFFLDRDRARKAFEGE